MYSEHFLQEEHAAWYVPLCTSVMQRAIFVRSPPQESCAVPPKPRPPRTDGRPRYAPYEKGKHPGVSTIPSPSPTGVGRPVVVVDEKTLYELAKTHAGFEHMGRILGVSGMLLSAKPEFRRIVDKARAEACQALLAAQFSTAIKDRNPTMQIWLGKQYLGQKDKQLVESSGPDGKPIQTETAIKAVAYFPDNGRNAQGSATVIAPAAQLPPGEVPADYELLDSSADDTLGEPVMGEPMPPEPEPASEPQPDPVPEPAPPVVRKGGRPKKNRDAE